MSTHKKMNRRGFLKGMAATSAAFAFPAIIPSSALGADGGVAPSNRIVMGLIGAGGQGISNMKNLMSQRGVQMVAVCDVDGAHAKQARGLVNLRYKNKDCTIHNDFRDITRRDDVDAVCVATPDHWHVIPALDAARHGKDMYVQKPLTLTLREGRILADEVKKQGRVLQTGSQQRSSREFLRACELVRNGRIGDLKWINVGIPSNNKTCEPSWSPEAIPEGFDYDFWLGPARFQEYHHQRCHYSFRFILDYSGGQVTNFGAHHLDIAQWAMGTDDTGPVEVSGNGDFPESGLFTTAKKVYFECTYENGVRMTCRSGSFGIHFEGTKGTIFVTRGKIYSSPKEIMEEKIGEDETQLYKSRNHFANFVDCVRSREDTICTAEIGHRSASLCHLGNTAMLLGRKLQWDPKAENFVNDDEANSLAHREPRGPWKYEA